MNYSKMLDFYRGKRVLVTGHTGFKGSWMCRILCLAGAKVCGYALVPPTKPSLFECAGIEEEICSNIGDIRDREHLMSVINSFNPEIIIHMAAQPIVLESYRNPVDTFEINVMGTVNICECIRLYNEDMIRQGKPCIKSFVNVTTDKVYENKELENIGYTEDMPLDGYDPYSNSKSCSELVTHSYTKSFLADRGVCVSAARAGNVIGGGDFAMNRIIPDCVRAALAGEVMSIRNPNSVRPYQHVLEPVCAYLYIAMKQYEDVSLSGCYNVGPDECDCITTGDLVKIFADKWPDFRYKIAKCDGPYEANFLKLNCDKLKKTFNWSPKWHINQAVMATVELSKILSDNNKNAVRECMDRQIREYVNV